MTDINFTDNRGAWETFLEAHPAFSKAAPDTLAQIKLIFLAGYIAGIHNVFAKMPDKEAVLADVDDVSRQCGGPEGGVLQ